MPIQYDYEAFLAKFNHTKPKTSDDCYTPPPVYQAVLDYVDAEGTPLGNLNIRRPFFPGGDFEAEAETYGPQDIVIDNPPFSKLAHILNLYTARGVRFFLFCPTKTATNSMKTGRTIIIGESVLFSNGAFLPVCFVTNLLPGVAIRTAPSLAEAIRAANKVTREEIGKARPSIPRKSLDPHITSVLRLQKVNTEPLEIRNTELSKVTDSKFFGGAVLLSDAAAARIQEAAAKAAAKAAAAKAAAKIGHISLSPAQQAIVDELNQANQ